jgi:hypothetical protein
MATIVAVSLFVTNPEIYAFSFVLGSIGFDVFLLFLSFQLKDQLAFVISWIACVFRGRKSEVARVRPGCGVRDQ